MLRLCYRPVRPSVRPSAVGGDRRRQAQCARARAVAASTNARRACRARLHSLQLVVRYLILTIAFNTFASFKLTLQSNYTATTVAIKSQEHRLFPNRRSTFLRARISELSFDTPISLYRATRKVTAIYTY